MSSTTSTTSTQVTEQLGTGLRVRHLTMMGLGSAVGAGLFLGAGAGIGLAGPAILVSYVVAGVLVVLVMRMLAEMAAALPSSGSFSTYADAGIGRWAGFTLGWLYWATLVLVLGVEITGASQIVQGWFPAVPQWVVALLLVVAFAVVNLSGVRSFGEFEFWFASIKVAVIVLFLVIGALLVLGLLPGTDPVGTSNLLGHGGFAPQGVGGIASGLLVVVFAFGGIEIITIAAAESQDPRRSIAAAARSVVWRILLFYVGSVAVMVLVLPWDAPELVAGPFVAVLGLTGIPALPLVMEVVVVVALLSAFNANVYGTSRMAFSLAQRGDGPRALTHVSRSGVPSAAVWVSIACGLVSVLLNWLLPDQLLTILLSAAGASLILVWLFIAVAQIRLRPRLERDGTLSIRMWGYPYLSWATLALLVGFMVLMLTDDEARGQLAAAVGLCAVLAGVYAARSGVRRARARRTGAALVDTGQRPD
ncbi:amino acid permease [Cellulomonas sp. P22]|uniref:amino acid permease n=1 Tax=Cellulomonas sp. P22 TaxID=3373189 RepID=UPI00379A074A